MMDVFTSSSQPWDKMDPKLQKYSHSEPMMDVFTSSSQPWDKMDPKLQKYSHSPPVWPPTSPRLA
jgi:hypothetical protein